ncbi:60S ribosomal protein L10A [Datura stramonium]|uniref:60S ribosomal protein L10A n=1 Tax=Datura stramonium TaxID=4076 RepID=A0ABS8T8B9_DATST|nr:60S ribosomal protein L10A [Datura stramonium]
MDLSEEETVDCCKVESPKLQAEPSDYHSVDSSSRQKHSPLFSLTPDEFHGKNLDDLLNKFWDIEGNPVTSNPNQEGQHVSYGAEDDMRDDQFFEQVVGDFNGHQYPSDQITPTNENNEISNSNFSERAARGRRRRLASAEEPIVMDKRQRRMIKNRESAQRSRARKQTAGGYVKRAKVVSGEGVFMVGFVEVSEQSDEGLEVIECVVRDET